MDINQLLQFYADQGISSRPKPINQGIAAVDYTAPIMPKIIDKNPKKRICPFLYLVKLRKVSRHVSGNNIGIKPSIISINANASNKIFSNYFLFGLLRYLKKSESASSTMTSSLELKLFL